MSVANSYARALFEVLRDSKSSAKDLDQMEQNLQALSDALGSSREVRTALFGPALSPKEKASVVTELSKKVGGSSTLAHFLVLLTRKKRLTLLPLIRDAFTGVRMESEGGIMGRVVSAEPLPRADVEALASAFEKKFNKKIVFKTETDAALLAGMKVTVQGVTYDGSLQSKLQRLREKLVFQSSSATH